MAAVLSEGQWELSYPSRGRLPGCELVFGTMSTGYDLMSAPSLDLGSMIAGDAQLPSEDGVRFGRDYKSGGLITFEVNVDTYDTASSTRHAANHDRVSALRGAWSAEAVRNYAGEVATLRTKQAGRDRVIYGRPRRFAPAHTRLAKKGHTPVIMDFATIDDRFYEDPVQSHRVTFAPSPEGGLMEPLIAPLTSLTTNERAGDITIEGELPTWAVMAIRGPIANPLITIGNLWRVQLRTTIAAGQTVTIDPRPFARRVLRSDGASLAGTLTRDSAHMSDMLVPPGNWEVVLRGTDATGTSYVDFLIRSAYGYL